jgi:hypothetical protein
MTVAVFAFVGFVLGAIFDRWVTNRWMNRWIDHRWYCGRRHPASHPCQPTPENLERWKQSSERIDRVEKLEAELKRLRRYG